jgi:hypothetical protein
MLTKAAKAPLKHGTNGSPAKSYRHPESDSPMRPDAGTQAQFKKKKEPKKYRYDSSLSPALDWDGCNPAREQGEALIRESLDQLHGALGLVTETDPKAKQQRAAISKATDALEKLRRLSKPFLNWAGKAERLSFDVPTLPLFVHCRRSGFGYYVQLYCLAAPLLFSLSGCASNAGLKDVRAAALDLQGALSVGINYVDYSRKVQALSVAVLLAETDGCDEHKLKPYRASLEAYTDALGWWGDHINYPTSDSYSYWQFRLQEMAEKHHFTTPRIASWWKWPIVV